MKQIGKQWEVCSVENMQIVSMENTLMSLAVWIVKEIVLGGRDVNMSCHHLK
jgi:hypothetical protein